MKFSVADPCHFGRGLNPDPRIRGSVPLTNGLALTSKTPTKIFFFQVFRLISF
jgi:hypothetical protein